MKTILLTGATDGIGLEAAKVFVSKGHHVLLHGRNPAKLQQVQESLLSTCSSNSNSDRDSVPQVDTYVADLSNLQQVQQMANSIKERYSKLDILINNAGVFKVRENSSTVTADGLLDIRFAVNTVAPYLLTKQLLPIIPKHGRIINLSSAAQAPFDVNDLNGTTKPKTHTSDGTAYAQSKLAILMWTIAMSHQVKQTVVALNPGSLLGTKMVREAYGMVGKDISIGSDIIVHAALSKQFATSSGKYFNNDTGHFEQPHGSASSKKSCDAVIYAMEMLLEKIKLELN